MTVTNSLHTRTLMLLVLLGLAAPTAAVAEIYVIDIDESYLVELPFGDDEAVWEGEHCGHHFYNGVVRQWYLKERNPNDFRRSNVKCRELINGTMGGGTVRVIHFSYPGDGTLHSAQVPLDHVPIGIEVLQDNVSTYITNKVRDVRLLHTWADNWYYSGYWPADVSDAAIGRTRGEWVGVECDQGDVVVGIEVRAMHGAGGSDQAEIRGARITCAPLVRSIDYVTGERTTLPY